MSEDVKDNVIPKTHCLGISREEARDDYDLKEYLRIIGPGLSPKTLKSYEESLITFRRFIAKPLQAANTEDILNFRNYLQDNRKNVPGSINTQLTALRAFYEYMEDYSRILKSPMRRIEYLPVEKTLPVYLTDNEIERMRKEALNISKVVYLEFETLLQTGVRVSELVNIKKCDIDFEKLTILIHGKGAKQRRVPFSPALGKELDDYINGFPDDARVFPYDTATIQSKFREMRKRAGITKKVTPHKMRTTYSTKYAEEGNVVALQKHLGHESLQTTQGYFVYNDKLALQDYYKVNLAKKVEEKDDKTDE